MHGETIFLLNQYKKIKFQGQDDMAMVTKNNFIAKVESLFREKE